MTMPSASGSGASRFSASRSLFHTLYSASMALSYSMSASSERVLGANLLDIRPIAHLLAWLCSPRCLKAGSSSMRSTLRPFASLPVSSAMMFRSC